MPVMPAALSFSAAPWPVSYLRAGFARQQSLITHLQYVCTAHLMVWSALPCAQNAGRVLACAVMDCEAGDATGTRRGRAGVQRRARRQGTLSIPRERTTYICDLPLQRQVAREDGDAC